MGLLCCLFYLGINSWKIEELNFVLGFLDYIVCVNCLFVVIICNYY